MKYKISMIEQKPKENKKESLIDINEFKNCLLYTSDAADE